MKQLLCSVAAGLLAASVFGAEATGIVTASTLNVRNRPDLDTSTAVTQLKKGDEVTILKTVGNWYEIPAPEHARVYVAADFFKDGKTTREVNLRTGGSINHQSYGIAPAGTELEAVESPRGGWVRVKPLPGMTCFVSTKYISVTDGSARQDESGDKTNQAEPRSSGKPESGKVSDKYMESLQLLRSRYNDGSAKNISVTGLLRELEAEADHPIKYLLTTADSRHYWIVDVKPEMVKDYLGRQVKVSGVSYHVRDWKIPVLEVTQLSR